MTTEQLSRPLVGDRLVDRWTRLYTRRLDDETARARRDEIASDRYDHIAAARAAGLTSAATSRALAARMLLGVPADLSWRRHHLRDERRAVGKENAMARQAPDQRGWLAAAAGIRVVSWILLIAVLSGLSFGRQRLADHLDVSLLLRRSPDGRGRRSRPAGPRPQRRRVRARRRRDRLDRVDVLVPDRPRDRRGRRDRSRRLRRPRHAARPLRLRGHGRAAPGSPTTGPGPTPGEVSRRRFAARCAARRRPQKKTERRWTSRR